tara:strand:+ start:1132 stop:1893 length:762 start_codon:yes stop_codon:yes gene_type:complete
MDITVLCFKYSRQFEMKSLRVENISLILEQAILADVSLELAPGERMVLLGPSGSGKTSLLRCLNRLESPTAGRVLLNNRDIRSISPEKLRRRIGMVFQTPSLFPGDPISNVAIGPALVNEILEEDEVTQTLHKVGLPSELWQKDVETMSVGERQRVALAQALVNRPEILLLDEPTSALDPTSARKIEELIQFISETMETSILVVTHNIEQARCLDVQTLVLINGKVRALGELDAVMNSNDSSLRNFFNQEKKY